jgi:hypothetical protein
MQDSVIGLDGSGVDVEGDWHNWTIMVVVGIQIVDMVVMPISE